LLIRLRRDFPNFELFALFFWAVSSETSSLSSSSTKNYFIVNMAFSDLVLTMNVLPVKITELVTDSRHWHVRGLIGVIFCKLVFFASLVSLLVSAQSLVWISIDRFVAVVFPLKLGLISSKTRTIAIVSTWICAGFFSCPVTIYSKLLVRGNDTFCSETNLESFLTNLQKTQKVNETYMFIWVQVTVVVPAPLLVMTILHTVIAINLRLQKKAFAGTPSNVQRHAMKKRRQAIKMAIAILILFYLCVIPHILLYFIHYWKPSCATRRMLFFVTSFSFYLSSTVNPILCLSFVESYRRGLRNIVCYFWEKRDNKMKKQEQINLKGIRNLVNEN